MNYKTVACVTFFLFLPALCFEKSSERSFLYNTFDSCFKKFGCSKLMYRLNSFLTDDDKTIREKEGPENRFDQIVQDTREALHFPEGYPKLIKRSSDPELDALAYVTFGKLVVTNVLKSMSYGCQRFYIFHEMVHQKYNHGALRVFLSGVTAVGFTYFCYKLGSGLKDFGSLVRYGVPITTLFSGGVLSYFLDKKMLWYYENTSDKTAADKCKCHCCLEEIARTRAGVPDLVEKGYLSSNELFSVAKEQKKNNLLCSYHRRLLKK
ncbi:hypothetical protein HN446_02455 [bacterium]|jgi:hypothetical protein|nr:hypothetical protein [bacterium]